MTPLKEYVTHGCDNMVDENSALHNMNKLIVINLGENGNSYFKM